MAIGFSVLLRYTDSDYPFDIFKLFLTKGNNDTLINKTLHRQVKIEQSTMYTLN